MISTFILWMQRKDHVTLKNCWESMIWALKELPKDKYSGRPSRVRIISCFFKPLNHNKKIRKSQ